MDTSDRINLIEALLAYVTGPEGPDFDRATMALDEFGFGPGPNPDWADHDDHFRARLQLSTDEKLLGLLGHWNLSTPAQAATDTSMWEEGRFRIFLSFVSAEGTYANEFKLALERRGVGAFLSHMDIAPNTRWQESIEQALNSCDALVALLTSGYHESNWTDQEVGWAYGRNVPVIAVRLGVDPYGFIAESQGVRGGSPEEAAAKVLGALGRDNRSEHKVARSVVHALEASPSYSATRTIYPHVEAIAQWDADLLDAMERAVTQNDWVSDAHYKGWGNPLRPRIEALLERHRPTPPAHDEVDALPFE